MSAPNHSANTTSPVAPAPTTPRTTGSNRSTTRRVRSVSQPKPRAIGADTNTATSTVTPYSARL